MKTTKNFRPITLSGFAGWIAAAFLFMSFASCQKDSLSIEDEAMLTPDQVAQKNSLSHSYAAVGTHLSEAQMAMDAGLLLISDKHMALPATEPDVFNVIMIDHQCSGGRLPDYSVTVRSNGLVIFEGRRNVRVEDRVVFRLSGVTIPVLKEIFEASRFDQIIPAYVTRPHAPLVKTTYRAGLSAREISKVDDYNNYPEALVGIRTQVEKLLGIDIFIYDDFPSDPQQPEARNNRL